MNTFDLLKLTKSQKTEGVWMSGIEGKGEFRQWWSNGQLREKFFWKNGKYHNVYEEWHPNGQLKLKTFYKNGKEIRNKN